jgi:hypothetical protein
MLQPLEDVLPLPFPRQRAISRQLDTATPICVPPVEKPSSFCGNVSYEVGTLDGRTASCPKRAVPAEGGGACPVLPAGKRSQPRGVPRQALSASYLVIRTAAYVN